MPTKSAQKPHCVTIGSRRVLRRHAVAHTLWIAGKTAPICDRLPRWWTCPLQLPVKRGIRQRLLAGRSVGSPALAKEIECVSPLPP